MPLAAGLFYEEHGPAGAPVLVLSSGLGGGAGYWTPNLSALAERYRVIIYDHRGTGRSARDVPGDLTLEAIGGDIGALVDALGLTELTLIGHAIGGMAGLAFALERPGALARLVVINGWAKLDPHTARCFDTRLTLLRDSPRAFVHAQPLFLYPATWISSHAAQLAEEEEMLLAQFAGAEMMRRRIAAARRFDIASRLGDITVPTLFVVAEDDMLVPLTCSEALHAGVRGSQLARMATGGHACNVTRAEHFGMWLLDWLDSHRD